MSAETYREKALRKFKEQPLVPIGAALTCFALITAFAKMRKGDSKQMNYWLRARVIAQGFTIAAVVGGSYAMGQTKQQLDAKAQAEAEGLSPKAERERAAFQARMKEAEEVHRVETAAAKGSQGEASAAKKK